MLILWEIKLILFRCSKTDQFDMFIYGLLFDLFV